jgi:predicted phosphodiesterase
MRLHVISDLHIEHSDWTPPDVDCDVVVVAGDAKPPATLALPWLRNAFPDKEILYIAGNHDYYSDHRHPDTKTTWEWQREHAPKLAEKLDIVWLDNGVATMGNVRFLGSTFWTDFMSRPGYVGFADAVRGALKMNDYRCIKTGRGRGGDRLKPRDTIDDHKASVRWLTEQLSIPFEGETVVVTHHSPSPKSLVAGKPYLDLDWCYASDCEHLMHGANAPSLWIHGHVHRSQDYFVGTTRVLCNPRGYPLSYLKNAPMENPDFIEDLVIEVGRELTPSWRL